MINEVINIINNIFIINIYCNISNNNQKYYQLNVLIYHKIKTNLPSTPINNNNLIFILCKYNNYYYYYYY